MNFKHPEILYFLFLLVIPILVHLFQLRRFKKEYFTNVQFLKELSVQTRKSAKLKKWLLLLSNRIRSDQSNRWVDRLCSRSRSR